MKTEYEKVLLPKSVQQELEKLRNETERLRTQAIADAAEIARLQSGFDELKQWILENEYQEMLYQGNMSEYVVVSEYSLDEINRITGDIER